MINNITIATADDIIAQSDDINIYPVDLSGAIITLSTRLMQKPEISDQDFFHFPVTHFWNPHMATECIYAIWHQKSLNV